MICAVVAPHAVNGGECRFFKMISVHLVARVFVSMEVMESLPSSSSTASWAACNGSTPPVGLVERIVTTLNYTNVNIPGNSVVQLCLNYIGQVGNL